MRVVFTDVDGVLNSGRWFRGDGPASSSYWPGADDQMRRELASLDPAAVARLQPLVAMGAVFVLSSTWRLQTSLNQMTNLLRWRGFKGQFVGATPNLPYDRGTEIARWLAMLGPSRQPDGIVILDDGSDMGDLIPYLVQTDYEEGLTDTDAARAVEVLASPFRTM